MIRLALILLMTLVVNSKAAAVGKWNNSGGSLSKKPLLHMKLVIVALHFGYLER